MTEVVTGRTEVTAPAPRTPPDDEIPTSAIEPAPSWTADEMMTIAAARALRDGQACFVGIGLPSTAANLARRLHAPDLVLIYESGTLDSRPEELPLSIGDGILADSALAVVERAGGLQLLAAARPDRRRLPLRGPARPLRQHQHHRDRRATTSPRCGCPAPAAPRRSRRPAGEVIVVMRHRLRAFVERVDFVTSVGHGSGPDDRAAARSARRRSGAGDHRPRGAGAGPGRPPSWCSPRCTRASPSSRRRPRPAGPCRSPPT